MAARVGVPMTERILEFLDQKSPGLRSSVWKIYYPMRDNEPIEVSVKPGSLQGGTMELLFENKKLLVFEESLPPERPERGPRGGSY